MVPLLDLAQLNGPAVACRVALVAAWWPDGARSCARCVLCIIIHSKLKSTPIAAISATGDRSSSE